MNPKLAARLAQRRTISPELEAVLAAGDPSRSTPRAPGEVPYQPSPFGPPPEAPEPDYGMQSVSQSELTAPSAPAPYAPDMPKQHVAPAEPPPTSNDSRDWA